MIISVTKLRYGLKNMANSRQERNMQYQHLQLGDFWNLTVPRRVQLKLLNRGGEEKGQWCQLRLMNKYWKWFMHNAGVVVNFHTTVGLATGIVLANDRTLLKEKRVKWVKPFRKRKMGVLLNSLLDGVKVSSKD